jgi:Immunity protein 50
MAGIESLIVGSGKLTTIFGYWPSFHDAEVLELHFWRGNIQAEKGIYDFPVLTLAIHVWELTREVDPQGYLICRHHTLTKLKFYDVDDFQMQGFNHQNAMMELALRSEERSEGPSPYFAVEVAPAFGMGASFKCLRVEVLDAVPCSDDGKPVSDTQDSSQVAGT